MYPLTTFPEKTPLCALSAEWLNTIANMLNGLQVVMVPGLEAPEIVAPTQAGVNWQIHIPLQWSESPGYAFPWDKIAFGYELNPDGDDPLEVRIFAGQVDKIAVSEVTLDLSDGLCVYLQHDLETNAITIEQGTSFPTDSEDYKYTRLYLFELNEDSTAAELTNIYRAMDIEGEALPTGEDGQLVQVNADGILECNWARMKNIT